MSLRERAADVGARAVQGLPTVFVTALFMLVSIVTCFDRSPDSRAASPQAEVVAADPQDPGHLRVERALFSAWPEAGPESSVVFVRSSEVNAASFGDGRFAFWEGLSTIPDWALDAVVAHEVAHDQLQHSRNARELQDVVDFVAEAFTVVTGTGNHEESNREWARLAALPRYSRAQELEADQKALQILRRMGYAHPERVVAGMLQILLDRYGDTGGGLVDSHPATSERIRAITAHEDRP